MKLTTTLGRGLAAIGTIGALSFGALIAAPTADAAVYEPEHQAVTAGNQSARLFLEFTGPLNEGEKIQWQIGNGATWAPTSPAFAGAIMWAQSGILLNHIGYDDCVLSSGDTVMTCTIVDTSDDGVFKAEPTNDWLVINNIKVPADARPADTFPVTITTFDAQGGETGHGTKTPYIKDIEEIVVTGPAEQSVITPAGQQFAGTSHAGATVVVTDADGNVVGQGTADANGNWTITSTVTFEEGTVELTFTETAPDALGVDITKSTTASYVVVDDDNGEGVPAMDPLYAGLGVGAALLAGAAVYGIRRRSNA